jgi:hypothetical protein
VLSSVVLVCCGVKDEEDVEVRAGASVGPESLEPSGSVLPPQAETEMREVIASVAQNSDLRLIVFTLLSAELTAYSGSESKRSEWQTTKARMLSTLA